VKQQELFFLIVYLHKYALEYKNTTEIYFKFVFSSGSALHG